MIEAMKLLSRKDIVESLEQTQGAAADLVIAAFEPALLQHSYYYFRLGRRTGAAQEGVGAESWLLSPGGFTRFVTLERFTLSHRRMGILGGISDLGSMGLQLLHSPFIDPMFDGHLEVTLVNMTSTELRLSRGQRIGKISFFDVSDSEGLEQLHGGSLAARTFGARREYHDSEPVPPWDDSPEPYDYDWRKR